MAQVGLIFVEIGLGFRFVALAHIVGHASLRTLQILRSPSILHDHRALERATGAPLPQAGAHLEAWLPASVRPWLYRFSLERGYFDAMLEGRVLGAVLRFLRALDRLDEVWVSWLEGEATPPARRNEVSKFSEVSR